MGIQHRTGRLQHLAIRGAIVALVACGFAPAAAAENDSVPIVRVRSTDPSLAALIDRAAIKSPTFQRLLATLQRTEWHGANRSRDVWPLRAGVPKNVDGSRGVLSIPPRHHRQAEGSTQMSK